jgi:hypothetical protein
MADSAYGLWPLVIVNTLLFVVGFHVEARIEGLAWTSTGAATTSSPPHQANPTNSGPVWVKCAVRPVSKITFVTPYPGRK